MLEVTEAVREFLYQYIPDPNWIITSPLRGGGLDRRFIGATNERRVFVRIGVNPEIVDHLAQASITPGYIAGGAFDAITLAYIQHWVDEAQPPDDLWYLTNWAIAAALIQNLQGLQKLRQYLPVPADESFRAVFTGYNDEMKNLYSQVSQSSSEPGRIERLLEDQGQRITHIEGEGLVPCHGDIHPENCLTFGGGAFLIDWETLHLSDPIRDVAHLIWRFPTQGHYQNILDLFTIDLSDPNQRERFFLHISTRALHIYLLSTKAGQEIQGTGFLKAAEMAAAYQIPQSHSF